MGEIHSNMCEACTQASCAASDAAHFLTALTANRQAQQMSKADQQILRHSCMTFESHAGIVCLRSADAVHDPLSSWPHLLCWPGVDKTPPSFAGQRYVSHGIEVVGPCDVLSGS